MKKRKTVHHDLRKYLVDGMVKAGHNGDAVGRAIDRWNDGSQPGSIFQRACFQAIQDIFVDMDKIERKGN